jgi:hypothetical protein
MAGLLLNPVMLLMLMVRSTTATGKLGQCISLLLVRQYKQPVECISPGSLVGSDRYHHHHPNPLLLLLLAACCGCLPFAPHLPGSHTLLHAIQVLVRGIWAMLSTFYGVCG